MIIRRDLLTSRRTALKLGAGALVLPAFAGPAFAADKRVAMVVKNTGNSYFDACANGAMEAAAEVGGMEIIYTAPTKPTPEDQIAVIDALIAQRVDGIIVSANDANALVPVGKKAMERGIVMMSFDSAIAPEGRSVHLSASSTPLIGAKQVSVGELVGKGEPTLLATISTLDPIWFYCNVSETQYLRAQSEIRLTGRRLGDLPIDLILADGSVHPGRGKIVFVDRAVDVKTGTIRLRAEFPNLDKSLRPGMFGRIRVNLGVRADSILIPQRAVQELQGKNFVWVVGEGNKASQRSIKAGAQIESGWLVDEGLKVGERIIVEGVQKVREGGVVNPMTAAPGPAKEKE